MIKLVDWIGGSKSPLISWFAGFLGVAHVFASPKYDALSEEELSLEYLEAALGGRREVIAETFAELAHVCRLMGHVEQALPFYERAVLIRKELFSKEDAGLGNVFLKMGVCYETLGKSEKAFYCFEQARRIWEMTPEETESDLGSAYYNIASMHHKSNKFNDAIHAYHRALEIFTLSLPESHEDVASTMNSLAVVYKKLDKLDDALELYQRALSMREQQSSPSEKEIGGLLANIAELHGKQGRYTLAYPLCERALTIFEKINGPQSLEVALVLSNRGSLERDLENFAQALKTGERVLQIRQALLGPDHPEVGDAIASIAHTYYRMGVIPKAVTLCEKGFIIQKRFYGAEHFNVCPARHNLALMYHHSMKFKQALSLYSENVTVMRKHLGLTHSDIALTLSNLGNVYADMGDFERALSYFQQALDMSNAVFGEYHMAVGRPLLNLGLAYARKGDHQRALEYYKRALHIFETLSGSENIHVAQVLNNMGALCHEQKQGDHGEGYFRRSLAIRESILGPVHSDTAESLGNLSLCLQARRQFDEALSMCERAIDIKRQALGVEHIEVGELENNLAGINLALGNADQALAHCKNAIQIEKGYIKAVFNSVVSEKQKLACVRAAEKTLRRTLAVVNRHFKCNVEEITHGLEWVLERKGIVLRTQGHLHRTATHKGLDAEVRDDWERRQELLRELSLLSLSTPDALNLHVDSYKRRVASLSHDIEELEARLFSRGDRILRDTSRPMVDEVTRRLPQHAALVEFVKVDSFDWMRAGIGTPDYYVAFVLLSDGSLSLVDIGEGIDIEHSIESVRETLQDELETCFQEEPNRHTLEKRHQKVSAALRKLHAKLWAPIEKQLVQTTQILISPDGDLSVVPFAALINDNGELLLQNYTIAYLSSGQDLLAQASPSLLQQPDLLALSNPDFGGLGNPRPPFPPLPKTQEEVEKIQALFPATAQICSLTAREATKSLFQRAIQEKGAPRVLHLATHAYFRNNQDLDPQGHDGTDSYQDPLLRSGLVFAGANEDYSREAMDTQDDSCLLTALEVTGINLHGCDLAVLSGCNTGFGKVHNGEGVLGLRRAFILAGVKNVMMSLWLASDEDTAAQMVTFYRCLSNASPAQALRIAQLQSIKALEEEVGFAPVSLWAPFIVQGGTSFETWKHGNL